MRKHIIKSFSIALFLILIFQRFSFCEEKYYPYPIIFVHGLAGSSRDWDTAREALRDYFYLDQGQGELKYFPIESGYLRVYDYGFQNNGDIYMIAQGLQAVVSKALSDLPLLYFPKKVIIVTHSMGGIITRSFLNEYPFYEDNIEKVVFIGTPHEGSPLASIAILIKREIPKIKDEIRINWAYEALDLSRVILNPVDRRSVKAYYHTLAAQMAGALLTDKMILKTAKDIIHIDDSKYDPAQAHNQGQGVAIGQLVVPATIISTRTFNEGLAKLSPIVVQSLYQQYDTFLNPASNNLFTPSTDQVVTIYGTDGSITGSFLNLLVKEKIIPNFQGFPPDNAIEDLSIGQSGNSGDAVVTQKSQRALDAAMEYPVPVWHCEETSQYSTILQAIDDKPVIEDVHVAKWPAIPAYIVVKVGDYLLADVEILSLTVDGNPVDLTEFDDGTGHYKPYVKFGKDFLKERPDSNLVDEDGNVITLYPGQFYLQVDLDISKSHNINLVMINAAGKKSFPYSTYIGDSPEWKETWAITIPTWSFSKSGSAVGTYGEPYYVINTGDILDGENKSISADHLWESMYCNHAALLGGEWQEDGSEINGPSGSEANGTTIISVDSGGVNFSGSGRFFSPIIWSNPENIPEWPPNEPVLHGAPGFYRSAFSSGVIPLYSDPDLGIRVTENTKLLWNGSFLGSTSNNQQGDGVAVITLAVGGEALNFTKYIDGTYSSYFYRPYLSNSHEIRLASWEGNVINIYDILQGLGWNMNESHYISAVAFEFGCCSFTENTLLFYEWDVSVSLNASIGEIKITQ